MRTVNSIQPRWRAFLVAMVSAVVVVATSPGAQAAVNYTPGGGPALKLVGTNVSFTNVPAGQTVACPRFDVAGQVISPGTSRPFGAKAVDLGALTHTCSNPYMGPTSLVVQWDLEMLAGSGNSWSARLADVSITVSAVNCVWRFEGTVDGTFVPSTQRWTPTGSDLVVTSVTGVMCTVIDVLPGDEMVMNGYLTNVPPAGSGPLTLS